MHHTSSLRASECRCSSWSNKWTHSIWVNLVMLLSDSRSDSSEALQQLHWWPAQVADTDGAGGMFEGEENDTTDRAERMARVMKT